MEFLRCFHGPGSEYPLMCLPEYKVSLMSAGGTTWTGGARKLVGVFTVQDNWADCTGDLKATN